MNGLNDLSTVTENVGSVMSSMFIIAAVVLIIGGFYQIASIIWKENSHSDDIMGFMLKGMGGLMIGAVLMAQSDFDSNALQIFKYIGMGIGTLIVGGIITAGVMFFLGKKKYKDYTKKTNELLLLSDDFLVLSSNLQTIDDQIVLNSKMIETLTNKKKENLTLLNSLLTSKRVRFDTVIADVRSTVAL